MGSTDHATPVMESPFSLLTSLRWDPILKDHPDCVYGAPFYLLGHHRERLLNAARWFNERGTYLQGWVNGEAQLHGWRMLRVLRGI
ncbi:hypothetical protein BGX38DRAFT_164444 [Terfezia claveryi]|nr:hypothetical protein BGX38DRAFT_164444 [Terfezia claveryi]